MERESLISSRNNIDFDISHESELQKDGKKYIAGAKDVHRDLSFLFGDIFVDKVIGQMTYEIWKPRILNPMHCHNEIRDVRQNIICVPNMLLYAPSFEVFLGNLYNEFKMREIQKISPFDAELFFKETYEYYHKFRQNRHRY